MFLLHRLRITNFKQLTDVSLAFPESGSVLIEGHNEAGKSSLFEAVYFALYGKSLISEQFYRIADLKQYGSEEMRVELDFSIEGRRFIIRRRCAANQTVQFECPAGNSVETVTGAREVTKRLYDELRFSAEALLNTCFVEQKCLENLEKLSPQDRQATINELLNLRSLTLLADEFKITTDDRRALQDAGRCVEVATCDEQLPVLTTQRDLTVRGRSYLYWSALWQQSNQINAMIVSVREAQSAAEGERATIAQRLRIAAKFQEILKSITTDLTLRVDRWETARKAAKQAEQEVARIETLAQQLPERKQTLETQHQWLTQLDELEGCERNMPLLADALKQQKQAKADYEHLLADWEEGERRKLDLEATQSQCHNARYAAQRDVDQRAQAKIENAQRETLLLHLKAAKTALNESKALAEQTALKLAEVDRLPDLQERRDTLTRIEDSLTRQKEDKTASIQVKDSLRHCKERISEARKTVARLEDAQRLLDNTDQALDVARRAEAEAERILSEVKRSIALSAWAEARESVAAIDGSVQPNGGLPERLRHLREQTDQKMTERARLVTRLVVTATVLIFGVLAAGVGALIHLAFLIGVGVVAAIGSGVGAFIGYRGVIAISANLARVREELSVLEGERRAMESQARLNTQQYEQVRQREAQASAALQTLGIAVPASVEEARYQAGGLSPLSWEDAQGRREATRATALGFAVKSQGLQQEIDHETDRLRRQDLPGLQKTRRALVAEAARLRRSLSASSTPPAELAFLELVDDAQSLKAALEKLQGQIAASRNAERDLPEFARLQNAKASQAAQEQAKAYAVAVKLGLEETNAEAWQDIVERAKQGFEQDCLSTPDIHLANHLRAAQSALDAAIAQCTILDTEQRNRRQRLDTITLEDLEAAIRKSSAAIETSVSRQQMLNPVRAKLRLKKLPDQSQALRQTIAVANHQLTEDEKSVASLPESQKQVDLFCHQVAQRQSETQEAWQATLPDIPLPDVPVSAHECLDTAASDMIARLKEFDVPKLTLQEENLIGQIEQTKNRIVEKNTELARISNEANTLRATLEATTDETPSEYLTRVSELNPVTTQTIEELTAAIHDKTEAIHTTQARRKQLADDLGLPGTPLSLTKAVTARDSQQQEIDIKAKATQIIAKTRKTITDKVMPLTLQNMRRMLPLLTNGRYQDVEWDAGANLLYVYDQSARTMQRKRVFSGGARDQISLALRLAFALATLPGESHARPGWLFLDEPLSSFDRQRTQDLVDLLTLPRGLIRKNFNQVFLVSHSESFDPTQFDYRVKMSGGAIVESTLPST